MRSSGRRAGPGMSWISHYAAYCAYLDVTSSPRRIYCSWRSSHPLIRQLCRFASYLSFAICTCVWRGGSHPQTWNLRACRLDGVDGLVARVKFASSTPSTVSVQALAIWVIHSRIAVRIPHRRQRFGRCLSRRFDRAARRFLLHGITLWKWYNVLLRAPFLHQTLMAIS